MKLLVFNGHIVSPKEERFADLLVEDSLITGVGTIEDRSGDVKAIDASGCWVTPGLIDLQVNGGPGCDFWGDPDVHQVTALCDVMVKAGVTTMLPTLITGDLDHVRKNVDFLEKKLGVGSAQLGGGESSKQKKPGLPIRLPGIHLEGPCLSPQRPGVHPPAHLKPLSVDVLKKLVSTSVKLITLAPELDPTGVAIKWLQEKGVCIALGHSNATYVEAQAAFDAGIQLVTHTYNAMPPIHHRAPGAVTAALLNDSVSCCVICDGQHVSAPAAQLVFRAKGIDRSILVTDIAHVGTSKGELVGSSILLDEAVRNVVRWGIATFQQAIAMATYNPAAAMGWTDSLGELAVGKQADIVIWDKKTLAIKHVIVGGEQRF